MYGRASGPEAEFLQAYQLLMNLNFFLLLVVRRIIPLELSRERFDLRSEYRWCISDSLALLIISGIRTIESGSAMSEGTEVVSRGHRRC